MDFFDKTDDELKESIIRLLVKMSRVDGEVTGKELLYLLDIGSVYGYSPEKVRSYLYEEETIIKTPVEEKDRMTILYVLLFLMKIDGKISIPEENMIFHYGFKLGFNESLIREMILVIKKHIGKKLPPDELLNQVKKYLN